MLDLALASLHHILVFALVGVLATEWALVRPGLDASRLPLLARIDGAYGGLAMALIAIGAARVFWGLKDSSAYLENWIFWAKIAAFLLVGALSVPPTLRFIRWNRAARTDPGYAPDAGEISTARRFIVAQAHLLVLIPILAAAMARGYGI